MIFREGARPRSVLLYAGCSWRRAGCAVGCRYCGALGTVKDSLYKYPSVYRAYVDHEPDCAGIIVDADHARAAASARAEGYVHVGGPGAIRVPATLRPYI